MKVINFGSSAMVEFGPCSNGNMMLTPKLLAAPAPSWPASMIPAAAPVMTMYPSAAIRRPNSTAAW